MKTIIAGSRGLHSTDNPMRNVAARRFVLNLLRSGMIPWDITEVISGTARGADRIGEEYGALEQKPVHRYPADWDRHGRRAGPIRNAIMAKEGEALVVFWDGISRGTENMIDTMKELGKPVKIFLYRENDTMDFFELRDDDGIQKA